MRVFALEDEVVERVVVAAVAAGRVPGGVVCAEVDDDVNVPAAFGAVRGDLVDGGRARGLAHARQLRLLALGEERVSAVAGGHGGEGGLGAVEGRRGGSQQVAASALFVAGVVGKEVLQQARRCLAWASRSAGAEGGVGGVGGVPGAMAAAAMAGAAGEESRGS